MTSHRPSSSRPSSGRRIDSARSRKNDEETFSDLKAYYLMVFDDIKDEITSKEKLNQVLQQAGRNPTRKLLDKHWRKSTECLTFDDFCDICKNEPPTSEDDLMKAFKKIDVNSDGYITNKELMKVMTTKGEKMSRAEVQKMIDEVDENGDGKLDYKEFSKMVMSTAKECKQKAQRHLERKSKEKSRRNGSGDGPGSAKKSSSDNDKPVPKPRTPKPTSRDHSINDTGEPKSPRSKHEDRPKSPAVLKRAKLHEPKNIKNWSLVLRRGSFFFDDDSNIVSQQFQLVLPEDSGVWITIEPFYLRPSDESRYSDAPIDTMLMLLRDRPDRDGNRLVTFTEQKDNKGKFGLRCDLDAGKYTLMPFTTGCRLKRRRSEPKVETKLVRKQDDGSFMLTKSFKEALSDIFEMNDLDANGLLSRDEFNMYNIRTSGEEVTDDVWEVVEEQFELKKGQITRKGFIDLNQMEADDNEGDTEDLWVTLSSMGYNKNLEMDEACPFSLEVYTEDTKKADVKATGFTDPDQQYSSDLCHAILSKGDASKVKNMKDLTMYTYTTDFCTSVALENKSRSKVTVRVDCSKSKNCVSCRDSLDCRCDIPSRESVVAHHIFPQNDTQEWHFRCSEIIVK
ncbi:unnamed protein product [Owenia fusiformis]|uniref:Uncharacterized protein n=1 Tax=Owenia fusiformis TaxID=6347 RepID=A0A8J1Y111_OWEFU|nr:unnamed protein product [Owenia fusiformis]